MNRIILIISDTYTHTNHIQSLKNSYLTVRMMLLISILQYDSNSTHDVVDFDSYGQRINIQRLRWLCYVVRIEEDAPARRVFDAVIYESRRIGRPYICWKDQIEEALSSISVADCPRCARSRGAWRDMLRQAGIR